VFLTEFEGALQKLVDDSGASYKDHEPGKLYFRCQLSNFTTLLLEFT